MAVDKTNLALLAKNPYFLIGLFIRLALIFFMLESPPVTEWYAPFLESSINSPSIDPWTVWMSQGGNALAFPYGYAMWIIFMPGILLGQITGIEANVTYCLSLLFVDLLLLGIFKKLYNISNKKLLIAYWLSPIPILGTYYFGYNDLIPVLFLVASLLLLYRKRFSVSGALLGIAISAKLSMALALPFFAIYFAHQKPIRSNAPSFFLALALASLIFWVPFLFSNSGLHMLVSNPEIQKIYQYTLAFNNQTFIYLAPLAFGITVFLAWSVKRINFDLFNATLGIGFLSIVLLTPASAGWYMWAMPLLIYYQIVGGKKAVLLCALFSALFVAAILVTPVNLNALLELTSLSDIKEWDSIITPLVQTSLLGFGGILIGLIWNQTISDNDYFKFSRKPFAIGIAGDSGSGKDTLSDAIAGLFGSHSVATLSGDDYHLWDRKKPLWQYITHLNPLANDLEAYNSALIDLVSGKSIHARHYSHETGRLSSAAIKHSNDIIIASGLHALHLPTTRDCLDLKIFLDIDEPLRRQFKVIRDTQQRGYSEERVNESIDKRLADSDRFIKPQIDFADLVISLRPVIDQQTLIKTTNADSIKLKLNIQSRIGINPYELSRTLIGICGLYVNEDWNKSTQAVELMIEGEVSKEDIELSVNILCPKIIEFLDINPRWMGGTNGLMQLIILIHINKLLEKRSVR